MGLAEKYPERYTVEHWKTWEGDWELIEGVPYAMASPRPINQVIVSRLAKLLGNLLEECEICHVAVELDWYISPNTVVRPDLLVFCGEIPERLEKKPNLIIEVVSPESKLRDEGLKFELYQWLGVKYYVLVYPDERYVKVFELTDAGYREKRDRLFVFEGCERELPFEEVFR